MCIAFPHLPKPYFNKFLENGLCCHWIGFSWHAVLTLDLIAGASSADFTSLLITLARVPGVFDQPFRTHRFRTEKALSCLLCSAVTPPAAGEDLDAALDQALARLGHD